MSESIGDAFVEIGAKAGSFYAAMGEIEKKFAGTSANLQGQAMALAGKLGLIMGGTAFLSKGISAAAEWEEENMHLAVAIKVAGGAVDELLPKINEYAGELSNLTVYDEGVIKSAMAMSLQMGVNKDRINDVAKAAIGLSAKYKLDLATSMDQVSRLAIGGTARWLSWKGVVDKSADSATQFAQALKKGTEAFSIAEVQANTMIGQWKQLANALGDASAGIGTMASDILGVKSILQGITEGMKWLGDASKEAAKSDEWQVLAGAVRASWMQVFGDMDGAQKESQKIWDIVSGKKKDAIAGMEKVNADANRKMAEDEEKKYGKFSSLLNAWKINQELANKPFAGMTGIGAKVNADADYMPPSAEFEKGDRIRLTGWDTPNKFAGIGFREDAASSTSGMTNMEKLSNVFNYEAHGRESPVTEMKRAVDSLIRWLNSNTNRSQNETTPIIY
jgi:hypothetical protein